MSKISKVTKLEPWDNAKEDDFGNIPYNIEFENGDKGVYRGNPTKGLTFTVDQDCEYVIEEVTSKKSGKKYTKVSKPKKDFNKGTYKPKTQSWEESLTITRDTCLLAAAQYYAKEGVGESKVVQGLADRLVKFVTHGTEPKEFEMWGEVHSRLRHRSSAAKIACLYAAGGEDNVIKAAMDAIKYIEKG